MNFLKQSCFLLFVLFVAPSVHAMESGAHQKRAHGAKYGCWRRTIAGLCAVALLGKSASAAPAVNETIMCAPRAAGFGMCSEEEAPPQIWCMPTFVDSICFVRRGSKTEFLVF